MDIVAAIDSFKGSATSLELNQAVLDAWQSAEGKRVNLPVADGGEGTAEVIHHALGGTWRQLEGIDLLFRKKICRYLLTSYQGKKIAVIESTEVIGIDLLIQPTDQTIRLASSSGLGELVKDAQNQDVDQIIVTLGGSGCSDGGLGLLQSLGARLEGITEGNPLLSTKKIDLRNLQEDFGEVELLIAADVTSPYTGAQGAARLFGKQKGGSPETLAFLDAQAVRLANQLATDYGIDLDRLSGSGAAGGIGGALLLLGAKMASGFTVVSQLIGLEEQIKKSDLVITGEGRIDQQTIHGKVPYGVARLAKKYGKTIIALCGSREKDLGELTRFLPSVFSIQLGPISLEEAMGHEETLTKVSILSENLSRLVENE